MKRACDSASAIPVSIDKKLKPLRLRAGCAEVIFLMITAGLMCALCKPYQLLNHQNVGIHEVHPKGHEKKSVLSTQSRQRVVT